MARDHDIKALNDLREGLRDAARREVGSSRVRRPHWYRRGSVLLASVILGAGAVAGAAELISVGDSVKDPKGPASELEPNERTRLAVTAPDPSQRLPWGVAIYSNRQGTQCAVAGQVRADRLGVIRGGVFRPYAENTVGPCGDLTRSPVFVDQQFFGGEEPRTLFFGRARDDVATVSLTQDGKRYRARPAGGGAFLFVFKGDARGEPSSLRALDRRGHQVRR